MVALLWREEGGTGKYRSSDTDTAMSSWPILCLTVRTTVTSARIPEENA